MPKRVQFTCDYQVRSSPNILFHFLVTPEGMTQWFADHVDIVDGEYIFTWDGSQERGKLVDSEEGVFAKYRMDDAEGDELLEFKIEKSEISNDTILYVSDFADDYEVEDQKLFWNSLIDNLRIRVGGNN